MQEIATINSQQQSNAFLSVRKSVLPIDLIGDMEPRQVQTLPWIFKHGKGLSENEREFLKFKIAETQSLISKPASEEVITQVFAWFVATKAMAGNVVPEAKEQAYQLVLKNVSDIIIIAAHEKILRGEFDGLSKFVPDETDFYKVCSMILEATQHTISYYQRLLAAPEERPTQRITAERMAEIEAEMKKAGAQ